MDIIIIVGLIIAAIIFFIVELFLFQGITLAGIAGLGCLIYANYHAYTHLGVWGGVVTSAVSAVACFVSIRQFMRSKALDRVSLTEEITSKVDRHDERNLKIGDSGITISKLGLIGMADINGKIVEVKSADGFLDEKTHVVVCRISGDTVLVEKKSN